MDALVISDPEGRVRHGGLAQGHPFLPLIYRDHHYLLTLIIPVSNLAVTVCKLKEGREKKFNPAPLEQGRERAAVAARSPASLMPAPRVRVCPGALNGAVHHRTAPLRYPAQRLPWTGRMAGCCEGKMLCHSELEGLLLGKGRQKEDPTHSAPNPNLATALEKPDPFPDPRQARRARPGMLISSLIRAPGKHRCGRPPVAWRGQDPNRAGLGAAPSPCAPRCFPRRHSAAATAGTAVPPTPAPCPAAPLRRMGAGIWCIARRRGWDGGVTHLLAR